MRPQLLVRSVQPSHASSIALEYPCYLRLVKCSTCMHDRRAPGGVSERYMEAFSLGMRDKAKTRPHGLSEPKVISEATVTIDMSYSKEEGTRYPGSPRRDAADDNSHEDESGGGEVPRGRKGGGAEKDPDALARCGPQKVDADSQTAIELRRQRYIGVVVCIVGAVLSAMAQFAFVYGENAWFADGGPPLLLER